MSKIVSFVDAAHDERMHAGIRFKRDVPKEVPAAWVREELPRAYDYPSAWLVEKRGIAAPAPKADVAHPIPHKIPPPPIAHPGLVAKKSPAAAKAPKKK